MSDKCPISWNLIKPLKSTRAFCKGKLMAGPCHSRRLRQVFSFFSFYGINWQLLRALRRDLCSFLEALLRSTKVRDAVWTKWFGITEHRVVDGMLIGTTMDLIGGFRYFQIDLNPSNDFRAIGVDWTYDLIVNSAFPARRWSICFSNQSDSKI